MTRHHAVPFRSIHVEERTHPSDAGVHDCDIEPGERVDRLRDTHNDLLFVGDIGRERHFRELRLRQIERRNAHALGLQQRHRRRADAARATGDDRSVAPQIHGSRR